MTEAEFARKAEAIRESFRGARFDERTADERGFASVFETEIKPKLIGQVETNLKLALEKERRGRIARVVTIPLLPVLPLILLICTPLVILSIPEEAAQTQGISIAALSIAAVMFAWGLLAFLFILQMWAKGPIVKDPNQLIVMEKLLERFGCRLVREPSYYASYAPMRSPILPECTDVRLLPDNITGVFDGRIPFTAWRATATFKTGKNTHATTFRGWYLRIKLPFRFSGTTYVRERGAKFQLGHGARGIGLTEVQLESPDFSRAFVVSSDDQHEARLILPPDVMHHLSESVGKFQGEGELLVGFAGDMAHVWMPGNRTELSDWRLFDVDGLIKDLHESFAELAEIRAFLRDIDVIAESEGFRAQAAKNGRAA